MVVILTTKCDNILQHLHSCHRFTSPSPRAENENQTSSQNCHLAFSFGYGFHWKVIETRVPASWQTFLTDNLSKLSWDKVASNRYKYYQIKILKWPYISRHFPSFVYFLLINLWIRIVKCFISAQTFEPISEFQFHSHWNCYNSRTWNILCTTNKL